MAGLLDWMLERQGKIGKAQAAWRDEITEGRQKRKDLAQGVGLAQALAGVGKGPQAPVQQPDGRFKTPMDPDAAAAVRLMQNPGSRGIGNQLATNVMDPAWQQQQQNAVDQGYATRQQVDMAASEEARRNQLFPGQLKAQDYAANQDRRQGAESGQRLKLNDLALQAAMAPPAPPTDAQIFEQAAGFPLPKDYIAGFNPNTKELEPIPAPNTEPYRKAAAEVDTGEKLSRTITRYLALVDAVGPTGTEFIGPKAGALRSAREDVISAYRERAALGTPTGGELARVEDILPDPTGYYRNSWSALGALGTAGLASGYIKESQMSPYRELLEAVTQDLDTKYKRNWWIPPTPGIRAP